MQNKLNEKIPRIKCLNKYGLFCSGILLALFSIIGNITGLNVSPVSAYSASISTSSSITLDVSPAGDGTSIHSESINVVSDCRSGYNLTIATPTGSNLYKYDSTNDTISNTASFTAVDGTSSLSSNNNTNKWGYTLDTTPTSSTIFSPLSSTESLLKSSVDTASPSTDINDTFNISYGIKVDSTITPGTYRMANDTNGTNGAIVYYLTMDTTCTEYTVSFNPNGGTLVNTNPDDPNPSSTIEQGIQEGISTKLISSESIKAPQESSYTDANNNTITGDSDKLWTFWGWNTNVDGTGDWYKDKESVNNLTNAGSTITLYAQWKQATLADMTAAPATQPTDPKQIDHNLMQDMTPEVCYNSPITTAANTPAATLLDYRGKVITDDPSTTESPEQYTVSKLPDNNCWMTKNLNLGRTGTDGPNGDGTITLTSDDTDLANNTTFILPAGDTTSYTATGNLAKIRLTNTSGTNTNGVYYSWSAAVANTNSISTNPTTSICPKNWDLPTDTMYTNLSSKSAYTSSNPTTAQPSSFLTNGGFTQGSSFYNTSYSFFWTNRSSSTTVAYGARVNGTAMAVGTNTGTSSSSYGGNKYYRKNIRCIASNGTVTINYDGNGTTEHPVTGTTATQENVEINSTNTQANGFTRAGWAFNGWNTAADGTGTAITAANASTTSLATLGLAPGSTITLYAQWLPQYTITYVNNCMTYASTNASCTDNVSNTTDSSQKINLANNPSTGTETGTLAAYNKWTLTGWKIKGWSTVADNSDNTNTEYGVGTTYTVPAGSSAGSGITLYAHWVPVYSIQYDGNGASNPNGMGTTNASTGVKSVTQTNVGEGDPVTLLASNFKKAGNGFAGWSTDPDAWTHFTDNDNTNDPVIYGPMETIDAPAYPTNGTNIITMYAVWVPAEKSDPSDPSSSPRYLQDFTASNCNAMTSTNFNTTTGEITPGSVIALTDKRDDEVYTIAKLADDKCWMIENLRLEHEGTVGNNKNDSTVTNQSLSQGYGGTTGAYGNFIGLATSESANFSNSTTSLSFADGGIYKSSANPPVDTYNSFTSTLEDIGTSNYPGYRFPRYNNSNISSALQSPTFTENYANAANPSTSGTYKTSTISSYGNYYTWAAAMANTNYYNSSSTSETANTSICPSNWHLPSSGTTTKEYGILSQRYGGTGSSQSGTGTGDIMSSLFRSFPNNFLYSGNFNGSSAYNRGSYGYYWSRSAYSNYGSYYLRLTSTNLNPSGGNDKSNGFSVRCLIGS
ncbi:InlB B-repeat-containing protein [Candidatus Saccharibacteria bacterium]|nr:InlB B-repeat-containing protein [Candidatus Saccharibacteria bacterium]